MTSTAALMDASEKVPHGSTKAQEMAWQEYSLGSVTAIQRANHRDPWTVDELEIAFDDTMTMVEKIDYLQRTYYAIRSARQVFRAWWEQREAA